MTNGELRHRLIISKDKWLPQFPRLLFGDCRAALLLLLHRLPNIRNYVQLMNIYEATHIFVVYLLYRFLNVFVL